MSRGKHPLFAYTPCAQRSSQNFLPCTLFSLQGPALHPAPPFEKGVDPKTFSVGGKHTFYGRVRIRNAGTMDFREPIYGLRSPSPLWVFCAFVQVGGIAESPWVFGDASRLHDLKRLSLFRRDEVPARNTNRQSGFAFTHQKVLGGSKGRFFKNAPWQGVGQRPTKGESKPVHRSTPFQAGRSPCTKHPQIVRLRLHEPKKVFEESKGRFSKNAPLAGCGTASHKERRDITLSAFHSALYRDLPQWNSLYGK